MPDLKNATEWQRSFLSEVERALATRAQHSTAKSDVVAHKRFLDSRSTDYFMKGCHSVPCFGATNSCRRLARFSITVTNGYEWMEPIDS